MLTYYKPKGSPDPIMSTWYPMVLVKDEFAGGDRLTCLKWDGSNPRIPYNPRQLPMTMNTAVTWRTARRGWFWFAAAFSLPDCNHEPDWPT